MHESQMLISDYLPRLLSSLFMETGSLNGNHSSPAQLLQFAQRISILYLRSPMSLRKLPCLPSVSIGDEDPNSGHVEHFTD